MNKHFQNSNGKVLTKDQDEKKINYMGLSELMRMIIIFVTFCLNKKKIKKAIVQRWGEVLVPPQGIYTAIPLSSSVELRLPPRWKMVTSG